VNDAPIGRTYLLLVGLHFIQRQPTKIGIYKVISPDWCNRYCANPGILMRAFL